MGCNCNVDERELQNFVVPPQLEMFRQNREKYKSVFLSFENDGNPFSIDYKGLNNRPVYYFFCLILIFFKGDSENEYI